MAGHYLLGELKYYLIPCPSCPAEKKRDLGCDQPGESPARVGKIELEYCPKKYLTPEVMEIARIYYMCRTPGEHGMIPNGIMPATGGLDRQSPTLMEAFSILDNVTYTAIKARAPKK